MSGNTLYDLAISMLEKTNPYRHPIEEFAYESPSADHYGRVSLCGSLSSILGKKKQSRDWRYADRNNYPPCAEAIAKALNDYAAAFPAPFSYKQTLRRKFYSWITIIQRRYNVTVDESFFSELKTPTAEKDTAIALVKELHAREGVSREELSKRLGINQRAVQKDLRKLDRELYEGSKRPGEGEYVPFYIGGQEVSVKVEDVKSGEKGDRKKYFRTLNTLHPIVLQENLMEAGILLQALAKHYYNYESEISRRIAVDIWCQLSDYAKERIRRFIAQDDPELTDLIMELEDDAPVAQMAAAFSTEREMVEDMELEGTMSDEEYQLFLMKRGISTSPRS